MNAQRSLTSFSFLTPAKAIAETVWKAYTSDKLHWYVPEGIAWIDRIKGFAPSFIRNQIRKRIVEGLFAKPK